jgi:hypothetical protein
MIGFRRYTNLAAAIHMLRSQKITLLNPATWDDRNDAHYMAEFKRLKGAQTVLALCFGECNETYHHWRVFSHGSDGVCVEFDKDAVLASFARDRRITQGKVKYSLIRKAKSGKRLKVDALPFLKRQPYKDEREYRVVYVDRNETLQFKDYDLDLGSIQRVTLSPWLSRTLAEAVRQTLRSIDGCAKLPISRSTLVDNETWKQIATRAA